MKTTAFAVVFHFPVHEIGCFHGYESFILLYLYDLTENIN